MKKVINFILFFILTAVFAIALPNFANATTSTTSPSTNSAHDEESLNSVISSADSGATITLENDITITKPIVIAKELIIDGNGHNVVGSNDWTSTSGNQTMFTAQLSDAKLTLKDINLKNGPKYGVQSYDGASVILDNVSISGFKYGGVLVNGGKLEVKQLHLGINGTGENNGIEIDKGAYATNNPTLVMNGVLTTESNENVVRPAENGHLTEFTIENSASTTNKIVLAGNKVVLTDSNNNVISETKVPDNATANVDVTQHIVTIFAGDVTYKITVNSGEKVTADLLNSHIKLGEKEKIDGYFTDSNFENEFDFNNSITKDTTVYAKISEIEEPTPEPAPEPTPEPTPEVDNNEKDDTPKTGVANYTILASLTLILSTLTIIAINKKKN